MTDIISIIRDRAAKRAAYQRTVRALRSMPLDVALDLDLHAGDAEHIATDAVYGREHRA